MSNESFFLSVGLQVLLGRNKDFRLLGGFQVEQREERDYSLLRNHNTYLIASSGRTFHSKGLWGRHIVTADRYISKSSQGPQLHTQRYHKRTAELHKAVMTSHWSVK